MRTLYSARSSRPDPCNGFPSHEKTKMLNAAKNWPGLRQKPLPGEQRTYEKRDDRWPGLRQKLVPVTQYTLVSENAAHNDERERSAQR